MDSTSDQRIVNNTMRHQYRVLDEREKAMMTSIKDKGYDFLRELHNINGTMSSFDAGIEQDPPRFNSRELSLAATKIEEAVMWATKHITK